MAAQTSLADRPKITLYWLEKSRAQRVVWLLEECTSIDYDIKVFKRSNQQLAPPELKKIHPLGKSPLISIEASDVASPLVLAESAFMAEYLCDHFATHLVPEKWTAGKEGRVGGETAEWLRYRYFMHYAEGSLMSLMVSRVLVSAMTTNDHIPFFIKPITRRLAGAVDSMYFMPNFKANFSFLEEQLPTSPAAGDYLCGTKLTAADILMSFPLIAASKRDIGLDKPTYPKLWAYVKRIEANEVYQRSIKKAEAASGEPYSLV